MRVNPKIKYRLGKAVYKSGLKLLNPVLDPKTVVLKLGNN